MILPSYCMVATGGMYRRALSGEDGCVCGGAINMWWHLVGCTLGTVKEII